MYGLAVNLIISVSRHLSNIDEISSVPFRFLNFPSSQWRKACWHKITPSSLSRISICMFRLSIDFSLLSTSFMTSLFVGSTCKQTYQIPDFPHNIRIRLAQLKFCCSVLTLLSLCPFGCFSLEQLNWDSQQGRDRATSGCNNNKISIGPILFLYY